MPYGCSPQHSLGARHEPALLRRQGYPRPRVCELSAAWNDDGRSSPYDNRAVRAVGMVALRPVSGGGARAAAAAAAAADVRHRS